MIKNVIIILTLTIFLTIVASCSQSDKDIITPSEQQTASMVVNDGTLCTGLWQVSIDKSTSKVDVVQLRTADKMINVLKFMEPPALTSMDIDWPDLNIDVPNNTIDIGIILSHPIPSPRFTGFDVRGVCFGPDVANADGWTIAMSPEFFSNVPFGYKDGLLGVPDSTANYEGLAGYKYYCNALHEDNLLSDYYSNPINLGNRGAFSAHESIQRNYHLDWNDVDHDMLVFNYAIYANYDNPTGGPPIDLDDFDMNTANSAEAFCIAVTETANSLYYSDGVGGGAISLKVEAWDWQNDIKNTRIESVDSSAIPGQIIADALPGSTAYSHIYEFNGIAATPTSEGDLDILVTVTDAKTFGEVWFLDLLDSSHALYDVNVYNCYIHTAKVQADKPQIYFTSFEASENEAVNWSKDSYYWVCHWFDGQINSNNFNCSNYGESSLGTNSYARRTSGVNIPTGWDGPIELTLTHEWTRDPDEWTEPGSCYDACKVEYSTDGVEYFLLDFADHPYDADCSTFESGWTWNFPQRTDHADLTPLISADQTIWIRFDMHTEDDWDNDGPGWTIFEMLID